ncbi:BnaC03g70300D [Brassica napus]|uniref:BnaC03g70300D protein n=1 Tax=Brassica napus TaxID=3708 RepID=A0A078FCB8_BRANA|nr:BnaC03g70300D [Brassica napus]
MGCCLSKKPSPIPLSSGDVKSPDPVKPDVNKPTKPVIELPVKPAIESPYPAVEEAKPIISEKVEKEEENATSKDVSASVAVEKSSVRTSSCTKEEVDAILIQCGKLSRSNSKTRRYSGSKRSFDFDQNERTRGGGGGEVEGEEERRKTTPQRNRDRGGVERANGSPRERRRRTPSRERERGGAAGGSRRVSRSPAKRSEAINPSGNLVISSNIKFVTVPATDPSSKRVTVKRSIGEACRTAAMSNVQPPPRRKPLGVIDQNATKGDKKKKMIKRENEDKRPQVISRSRSLRRSRDFDLNKSSYTALLLKDIKDFHGKSSNDDDDEEEEDPFTCSIVEAVADLNSTSSDLNRFRFTSTVKKVDLVEPRFEKYVTVKRGCCSLEKQESCGSNNLT